MREIKFKAYNKKKKRILDVVSMHYGCDTIEWGWYVTVDEEGEEINIGMGNGVRTFKVRQYELKPSEHILLQYTGHKDKNGKEGYYKDIVLDEFENRYIIEWSRSEPYLTAMDKICNHGRIICSLGRCKIIGSELLQ